MLLLLSRHISFYCNRFKGSDDKEYTFEVKRRDEMSEDEIQKCFDILKTNMKSFYEDSTWGWNDKKKSI